MEVEADDGSNNSTLLAFTCADKSHVNGSLQLDSQSDKLEDECRQTRAGLEKSNCSLVHGAPGRGPLRHHQRPVRRLDVHHGHDVLRHHRQGLAPPLQGDCGFNVKEDGKNVAYKVMDGKAWYKMAEQAGDAKKNMSNTYAVVIRGLPFATACVETYSRLLAASSRPTLAPSPSRSC